MSESTNRSGTAVPTRRWLRPAIQQILVRIFTAALLGGVVGVVATLAATAFVAFVLRTEGSLVMPLALSDNPRDNWKLAALLITGGLIVGGIRRWNRPSSMQGPANAIGAAHGLPRILPLVPGLRTLLATLVSIGCGASVGQYGPLAHLGALIGSLGARLGRVSVENRSIGIACGAAAAISAAFDAPIAGIIFAHEVILRHFSLRAFAPVTVASSIAYVLIHFVIHHDPIFELADPVFIFAPEIALFVLIGIAGGLVAVLMMRSICLAEQLARLSRLPEWLQPAVAGAMLAVIAIWTPGVLGVGQSALRVILEGGTSPYDLGIFLVAKLLATALCLGFGFVGGVFSPALLLGVLFGALCGASSNLLFVGVHSDVVIYAACGMVAVVSPVIGAPITAILIVFELTRNYDITTAAMLSAALSNLISYRMFGRSYYDYQLLQGGYDISLGRVKLMLSVRTVGNLVDSNVPTVSESSQIGDAVKDMIKASVDEIAVLDNAGQYLGLLRLGDAVATNADTPVKQLGKLDVMPLVESTPIWQAMDFADRSTIDHFPVVDGNGIFQGMVSRRDLVAAYLSVARQARREQHDPV
ncbi:MAG: hypothetical protein DHS20C01_17060 [marine bacterium B5-7]|nr:MAG: hypothetical protein DHS20C01_17060 [marine bacterium B5-7]